MQREQEIRKLAAQIVAEKDAKRALALKAELAKLAQAEIDARKAAAAEAAKVPQPMYPVGLEARFGSRRATITGAKQGADGAWEYTVDLKAGMPLDLGDGTYNLSEAELRQRVAEELGPVAAGQAYPKGILIMRRGRGGLVETVEAKDGGFSYQLRGWPTPVTQVELQELLRGA